MPTTFSNNVKFKSTFGIVKFSNAFGHYQFRGTTSGLALKYVVKGKEVYYIQGQIITVPEDHFILIRPETSFEANPIRHNMETKGLCIDMSLVFPKVDIDRILTNDLLFNQSFGFSKSTFIGQQLDQTGVMMQNDSRNALSNDFLSHIGNHLSTFSDDIFKYKKKIFSVAKKESTQQYIIPKMLQAKEYIVRNYTQRILLSQLAQHVGISKFQFLKLFKKCFNISPWEMQSTLRMHAAKRLLQQNMDSISEIAFELGYFDLAAFSKTFKSYFGVSPSYFKN